jgi:propionyl-CoA carboxylase beta chain
MREEIIASAGTGNTEWGPEATRGLRRRQAEKNERDRATAPRQHRAGKLTARERVYALLDPGSFTETGSLVRCRRDGPEARPWGDAVLTGHGTVDGRDVCVFAQDFTVFGGSLGEAVGEKIVRLMDWAADAGAPVIGINDSAGGRIQEGVVAQALYGEIFRRNVRLSGQVPQISLVLGPCAGGAVYSPALTDFVVVAEGPGQMFVTGPKLLRYALGEEVSAEELGGALLHGTRSGAAHHVAETEAGAFAYTRELLGHFGAQRRPSGPDPLPDDRLAGVLPGPSAPYDVRDLLRRVLDGGSLLEVHRGFAPNVLVGFGRLGDAGVGVVASQPGHADGLLDGRAAVKAARFVRTCDAFGIPILVFVDTPGATEDVSPLLFAFAEATVPVLTVLTRRADGLAYVAMGSRRLCASACFAWPTARIAGEEPYHAADLGQVDEVIEPGHTRLRLHRTLRLLQSRAGTPLPRKHDNLPL